MLSKALLKPGLEHTMTECPDVYMVKGAETLSISFNNNFSALPADANIETTKVEEKQEECIFKSGDFQAVVATFRPYKGRSFITSQYPASQKSEP